MTTPVSARPYLLDQFLQCHHCDSPILIHYAEHPTGDVYRCSRTIPLGRRNCAALDVRATQFEHLIIQEVMETIMTPRNIRLIQKTLRQDGDGELHRDPGTIGDLVTDPLTYNSKDVLAQTRKLLPRFINKITIQGARAVVHYSTPLPNDSPMAGQLVHHINLPAKVIT